MHRSYNKRSGLPCFQCGTEKGYEAIDPNRLGQLDNKISICDHCPYIYCRGCKAPVTINDPSTGCRCGAREFCPSCMKECKEVKCPHCSRNTRFACEKSECETKARADHSLSRETCGYCNVISRCNHLGYKYDRTAKDEVYCDYESSFTRNHITYTNTKDIGNERMGADWCDKWICPGCISKSARGSRHYCKEHFSGEQVF